MPKRYITEESVLFLSILKWFILSSAVGAIVGLSTSIFLKILSWSSAFVQQSSYYFLLLPVAMMISIALVKYLAPDAEGHGTEKVIEAIHKHEGHIPVPVVPIKLLATVITLAAGGSVGKEGPCAQIGAGLASAFADLFKFNHHDRKKLVICGISAGFASVFGTPIAGAIFGVEVLFVGTILYDVLLPSFVAGIIGYQVSSALGIKYFHQPISVVPVFSERFFLIVVGAGIVFGLWSTVLIGMLGAGDQLAKKVKGWPLLRGAVGGLLLIGLTLLFHERYLGLGLDTIVSALQGHSYGWQAPVLKAIFTAITLGFGGSGGIITPIFFLGATSGAAFGQTFGLDIATFAAIGFVCLVAGAAQTPIAASVMAVEMFGPKIAPYAAIACVISFLMTGHRSVYPSQILAIRKSESLKVAIGEEIETVEAHYQFRRGSLIHVFARLMRHLNKSRSKQKNTE